MQLDRARFNGLTPLLILACALQIIGLAALLGHSSDTGSILGRYSTRYALALAAALVVVFGWGLILWQRQSIQRQLAALPRWLAHGLLLIFGLGAFATAFLPLEPQLTQFIALNFVLAGSLILLSRPDSALASRVPWQIGLVLVVVALLALLLPHLLTTLDYSPDEAHWADFATALYTADGVYSRTWLQEPIAITPGLGWSVPAYGWLLQNVAFDIRVGRLWNLAFHLLAVIGVALVAARLYGHRAAWAAGLMALLSLMLVPMPDYRPHQQLPAALMFTWFAAAQGRYGIDRHSSGHNWHFLAGLLATLSLQLHAGGIVYAAAFSLIYAVEALMGLRRDGWRALLPALAFAVGAALGTVVYLVANVAPVGGISAFLENLAGNRFRLERPYPLLTNWSLLEFGLVFAGLGFALWRRQAVDRFVLAVLVAVAFSALLLDTQGYFSPWAVAFWVPAGAAIASLCTRAGAPGWRYTAMMALIIMALLGPIMGRVINWPIVGQVYAQGRMPDFLAQDWGEAVLPRLLPDDRLASSHELIWTLQDDPRLIAFGAEASMIKRFGLADNPALAWERIQPTVIIDMDRRTVIPPGLATYMEQTGFELCETFMVRDLEARVYRIDCVSGGSF